MSSSNARPARRVVVDLNLFISGLIARGLPSLLLAKFRQGAFTLIISSQLRTELEDVLSREKFRVRYHLDDEMREAILFLIDTKGIVVNPRGRSPVPVRDPKDEIVVATSISGHADVIVTGDEELLVLNGNPQLGNLHILTARAFLDLLEQDE